ncbi:MAG: hypothetical protein RQ760_14380 [Sedimentisphaerales bacterium]|nr:hypothetical protein [Sedimentisphaerales bacterium]
MESQNKYVRRRFKIWHGIAALLLLLFVLFRVNGSLKLKKQIEILRTKGYPVTLEELNRWYDIPDGVDNAADVYMDAFSNYVEWDSETRKTLPVVGRAPLPARTQPMDDPNQQLVKNFLSDNEKILTLLHEAASIKHCRYPIDFNQESDPAAPWLKNLRNCTHLLHLNVLIQCENNNSEKAMESIRTNLSLAKSSNVPLLIHRLVQIAVKTTAYNSIERLLNRIQLTEEQLMKLSAEINTLSNDEGYKRVLIGENCIGLQTFQGHVREVSERLGSQGGLSIIFIAFLRLTGLNDRDAMKYIDIMQEFIDAMELPANERLLVFDSIQKDAHSRKRGGMLTRMLMPAFGRIMQIETRHLADLRVTQTALVIERYRLADGHLPESLDDLVPAFLEAVPTDPFDGQNLKYRKLETGFVVYSVGDDLTDEGGAERDGRKRDGQGKPLPWDVTFIVER